MEGCTSNDFQTSENTLFLSLIVALHIIPVLELIAALRRKVISKKGSM
jgi:hypothetical protein